jgi:poly(3-hydroxybutyrate) depolymerase
MRSVPTRHLQAVVFASAGVLIGACNPKGTRKAVDPSEASTPHQTEATGTPCVPVRAAGNSRTIDDFEANPGRISGNEGRDGFWFDFNDGSGGKLLRQEQKDDSSVLHISSSGFSDWGAGVGASFLSSTSRTRACGYDASVYTGLRLRARGKGRIRLLLAGVSNVSTAEGGRCTRDGNSCYDLPGVWVDLAEQWQTIDEPFCSFVPEGWGGDRAGIAPSELVNVQFRFQAAQQVEFWIDDLSFYSDSADKPTSKCERKCPLDAIPRGATIAPAVSTATLTEEFTLHTFEQATKHCGTLTRRYFSFIPKQLTLRTAAPVLLVLHGAESNAESMQGFMTRGRFDELARRDGFIVVYANAAPGSHTNPLRNFPNTGSWRQEFFDDGEVDDVDYLMRVVEELKARRVIGESSPVYLVGISNGGGMVLKAARERPERFRGVAAVMAYDGDHPAPVPELRGKGLNRMLFLWSETDPGLPKGYVHVQKTMLPQWARALGLAQSVIDQPKRIELPDRVREGDSYQGKSQAAISSRGSRATKLDMSDENANIRLCLISFDRAGHFWPHPGGETEDFAIERWGFRNQDVNAADLVWEFFSRPAK